MHKFIFYKQLNEMDCGPSCLRMIAKYYGKTFSAEKMRKGAGFNREGVSLSGIGAAAENIGFRTAGVQVSFNDLFEMPLPAILHWRKEHYVVLLPLKGNKEKIKIADPAFGIEKLTRKEFIADWAIAEIEDEPHGIALLLEPTANFFNQEEEAEQELNKIVLLHYLKQHKSFFLQLILGLILGSLLQLLLPFLTQSIVDNGITAQNLQFINLVLIAQVALFLSRTVIEFIRGRLLLYISTRVNFAVLSDFWIKIMRLPMSFFDAMKSGKTLENLIDIDRIELFLTGTLVDTTYGICTILIFSVALLMYSYQVFLIFIIGSVGYLAWVRGFMKMRRKLDDKRFKLSSVEHTITLQLLAGMQEIKLNGSEQMRRWEWESVRVKMFKLKNKILSVNQTQHYGAMLFNEAANILITFYVARQVIKGDLTLGGMLAVQYIIGQLNAPVQQLLTFLLGSQEVKQSMERLNEIYHLSDEEPNTIEYHKPIDRFKEISIKELSFSYPGVNKPALKNITLNIKEGQTTAIVGTSGSGKTTLLKILLRFYENYSGDIKIGSGETNSLTSISPSFWRSLCGAVMQDGFIYNDTIARNIATNDEIADYKRLITSCEAANILNFIEGLPLAFNTKIGMEGNGISQGQKQRILIARAIYRNPDYFFFDEATNALDAENEKVIVENLQKIFNGKTVIIVAHRLSTVKNAKNIIVLHQGEVTEQGNHDELIARKGDYYNLIKNQLELGE